MSQTLQLVFALGVVICIVGAFIGPGFGATAMKLGGTMIGIALALGWLIARLVLLGLLIIGLVVAIVVVRVISRVLRGNRRRYDRRRYDDWHDYHGW